MTQRPKDAMSTQWKKYPQDIPESGEPIWWLPLDESSTVRFYYFELQGCKSAFFWQPAFPPPAPPDESLFAFNHWWNTDTSSPAFDKKPYEAARLAWNAALAWHKNKTKE